MQYKSERIPEPRDIENLIAAAAEIEPEWVTLIHLAWRAGILPAKARSFSWDDLQAGHLPLRHPNSDLFYRRELPVEVLSHLEKLPKDQKYFCPRLQQLSRDEFHRLWDKLKKKAGVDFAQICLVWPYRNNHKVYLNWECGRRHLEALADKYLTPEQRLKLDTDVEAWFKMPPKKGSRARRLSREEILMGAKNNMPNTLAYEQN
jgi:hypothetical protein